MRTEGAGLGVRHSVQPDRLATHLPSPRRRESQHTSAQSGASSGRGSARLRRAGVRGPRGQRRITCLPNLSKGFGVHVALFECPCGCVGVHVALFECPCGCVGVSVALFGVSVALFGVSVALFGVSVALFGVSVALFGVSVALFGVSVALFGVSVEVLGVHVGVLGVHVEVLGVCVMYGLRVRRVFDGDGGWVFVAKKKASRCGPFFGAHGEALERGRGLVS
jgi:hypothetical protein